MTAAPSPAVVVVAGPGHHRRAEEARPVVAGLVAAGFRVAVDADLRPNLADDMRALLDAGAASVRLAGPGVHGDLHPAATVLAPPAADVVVRLSAAAEAVVEVQGSGPIAERVRAALAGG